MPGHHRRLPVSGDELIISRTASVQFTAPFRFRVIAVVPWQTYTGWCWLDGYVLNTDGEAVERRRIFVQTDGLHQPDNPSPSRQESLPPRRGRNSRQHYDTQRPAARQEKDQ